MRGGRGKKRGEGDEGGEGERSEGERGGWKRKRKREGEDKGNNLIA